MTHLKLGLAPYSPVCWDEWQISVLTTNTRTHRSVWTTHTLTHYIISTLWQSLEEVVSQAAQGVGVPLLSCYTSFGSLNISITFSNAHLVLLCYIFRFSNDFKHVKMSRMPQQGQFFLLCVWGLHNSCTASNHHFPPQNCLLHYFDCKIGDQDKSWAPHICCKPCYNGLTAWFNGKKAAFNFAVPVVWREPQTTLMIVIFV